jgi:hypothetical protein
MEVGNYPRIVPVEFRRTPFPQTVNGLQHKIARGLLPVVNYAITERAVYFVFPNSAKAQDAYAYFLFHQPFGPLMDHATIPSTARMPS